MFAANFAANICRWQREQASRIRRSLMPQFCIVY